MNTGENIPRSRVARSSGTGWFLTFSTTLKSNVGIAILAMPYAFDKAGWLGAGVMFALTAAATAYTVRLFSEVLSACKQPERGVS